MGAAGKAEATRRGRKERYEEMTVDVNAWKVASFLSKVRMHYSNQTHSTINDDVLTALAGNEHLYEMIFGEKNA
jgi:hypothetical protein